MVVVILAADEHEFIDGPGNRLDRIFLGKVRVVQKRDMRREVRIRPSPQSLLPQRVAKYLPKRYQLARSFPANQNEWTTPGLASKADGAIERDFERPHPHAGNRIACHPNGIIRQSTEEDERDVETIRRNGFTGELVGTSQRSGQSIDARRHSSVWNGRQKPSPVDICVSLHDSWNKS
jgi:hypothetical protein